MITTRDIINTNKLYDIVLLLNILYMVKVKKKNKKKKVRDVIVTLFFKPLYCLPTLSTFPASFFFRFRYIFFTNYLLTRT